MEKLSKYWEFFKINSAGNIQLETIVAAQMYFKKQFVSFDETLDVTDTAIVSQLWQNHLLEVGSCDNSKMPELCLRCYISNSIKLVCFDLETEFGKDNGFSSKDLLPFVLYDEVLSQSYPKTSYKSLATSIIQTFNPNKGSLKTWVKRYVKQHP